MLVLKGVSKDVCRVKTGFSKVSRKFIQSKLMSEELFNFDFLTFPSVGILSS